MMMTRFKNFTVAVAVVLSFMTVHATSLSANRQAHAPMNQFIDELMGKMTLQEKIGQLNLPVTGDIITGSSVSGDVVSKIKAGQVGGLFNMKGVQSIRALQEVAVKQSRLGIPLIFGMDVIHGYETVFPIPLAMSMSWDMDAIRNAAPSPRLRPLPTVSAGHSAPWWTSAASPDGDVRARAMARTPTWARPSVAR